MREMKDSGVEWIGKIPKDWEIVPLTKQLDSIVDYRGKTPEKTEEGTFLVTAKNIKDGKICYELSKEYVREADYEEIMHRGIPQIGDILFTTEAPLGQVANVDRTDIALAQRIIKFRALSTVNNYYLKYWMLNEGFQQFLHSLSNVVYDMKNTLDDFRVYQKSEVDKFADIFYQNENQSAGDLGKLQGQLRPAIDRYEVLEVEKQDIFKSTLASFNRVYAYITQVCRLFDKDIHRFSIYSKFLYTMLPKGHGGEKINIDDKVLLEYYKLEKDFEGPIELESTEGGYTPISGDSGHREPKKDPLTVIIDKINEKYGTHFTEMDKVLVQMENDYANQEKWQSYAKNNDRATFMLLFEKDFPNMAADRYEQNDQFFRKLFDDPDMMRQVMETVGSVLYDI